MLCLCVRPTSSCFLSCIGLGLAPSVRHVTDCKENGNVLPCPWKVVACLADFRFLKGKSTIFLDTPDISQCETSVRHFPLRIKLPPYNGPIDESYPAQDVKIDEFITSTRSLPLHLPEGLVDYVASNKLLDGPFITEASAKIRIIRRFESRGRCGWRTLHGARKYFVVAG